MVMEFIEGKTLKEVLKERGRIQETEVLSWGKQLCEVLSYLHSRTPPIIYRDLKPDNIILKKTGRLVLIDFGTAREYCYEKNSTDTTYLGTRDMRHRNSTEEWDRRMRGRIFTVWELLYIVC